MVKLKAEELRQAEQEKRAHEQEHVSKDEKNKQAKEKAGKEIKSKEAAAKEVKPQEALAKTVTLHDMEVIKHPLVTEKAVGMIESENKITFIVDDKTNKSEIKKVIQEAYGVKVQKVNVVRDMKGRKKAIVKLDKKNKASELATKLGVL
jgi:ribosomal protein uL23